jgi:hypothetical protein
LPTFEVTSLKPERSIEVSSSCSITVISSVFIVIFLNVLKLLVLIFEKYLKRNITEEFTGMSHDQIALFKTIHGTAEIVQTRQSTAPFPE